MKSKGFFRKRYVVVVIIILIIGYFVPALAGFSWTERSAIRDSFPYEDGLIVFDKDLNNKKVIVWDTGQHKYIKLIENKFGLLYRPLLVSGIEAETLDKKMNITWAATYHEEDLYFTLFAADVFDKDIVKVIVSNEANLEERDLSLKEVEEQSSIFEELDVDNGIVAHFAVIPYAEVGHFTFRGIDAEGNVVSVF